MLLRNIILWIVGIPVTFLLFFFVLLSLVIDRSGNLVHSIGRLWFKITLLILGIRVHVEGKENIPKTAVTFMSNHPGTFDIPVLQCTIPVQFRWVAKISLFKIPIVGWSMSLAGYVSIERARAGKAYKSIEEAAEKIKKGTSVLIFPEGERNVKGGLLSFKRGGFLLVEKSEAPIIPISLSGTSHIVKIGGYFMRPADVTIVIGKPIETTGRDSRELMEATRKAIEEGLQKKRE